MAATKPTRRHGNPPPAPLGWRRVLAIFICLWFLAIGLQVLNRAWNADFGAHPDEAAHVVTGLMARDYLAGGFLTQLHPLRYAETYYDHFPKVALGHYPPGFYISEALFLLPYPSTGAVLLHLSAIAAGLALLTFVVGRHMTGNAPLAFTAAAILLLLPVIQRYTSVVMADLLVALLMLASAVAFARFLVTARSRDSDPARNEAGTSIPARPQASINRCRCRSHACGHPPLVRKVSKKPSPYISPRSATETRASSAATTRPLKYIRPAPLTTPPPSPSAPPAPTPPRARAPCASPHRIPAPAPSRPRSPRRPAHGRHLHAAASNG